MKRTHSDEANAPSDAPPDVKRSRKDNDDDVRQDGDPGEGPGTWTRFKRAA